DGDAGIQALQLLLVHRQDRLPRRLVHEDAGAEVAVGGLLPAPGVGILVLGGDAAPGAHRLEVVDGVVAEVEAVGRHHVLDLGQAAVTALVGLGIAVAGVGVERGAPLLAVGVGDAADQLVDEHDPRRVLDVVPAEDDDLRRGGWGQGPGRRGRGDLVVGDGDGVGGIVLGRSRARGRRGHAADPRAALPSLAIAAAALPAGGAAAVA